MHPKILKCWNFRKYWRWWRVQPSKFTKIARWRDFNALRRPTLSFTWLVEWLHRRVISSAGTFAPRRAVVQSIRFQSLTLIFVTENDVIRTIVQTIVSADVLGFVFCDYDAWALRIKKVTRAQATWCMDRKFWNDQIFENIDAGERFRPLNPLKSLAGAISMPCGAPRFIHMTRRLVTP